MNEQTISSAVMLVQPISNGASTVDPAAEAMELASEIVAATVASWAGVATRATAALRDGEMTCMIALERNMSTIRS